MTNCVIDDMNTTSKKTMSLILNNSVVFKNSDDLKRIVGKREQFKDFLFADIWNKRAYSENLDTAFKERKKLDKTNQRKLAQYIRDTSKKILNDWKIVNVEHITPLSDSLKQSWYSKDMVSTVKRMEERFNNSLHKDWYKIWNSISDKRWIEDIYENIITSWKYAFMMEQWVNKLPLETFIKDKLRLAWVNWEKNLQRLYDDIIQTPLGSSVAFKQIGALKQLYTNIKYGPVNPVWGTLLFLNNLVMWNLLLMSRKRWLEWLINHKTIDELFNKYHFLKSQDRVFANISQQVDIWGKNRYFKSMEWLIHKLPIGKQWQDIVNSIFTWGIHNWVDMILQNNVKRTSIAQALAHNWITGKWIDRFYKLLEEWKIDEKRLDKLRGDAALYYHDFFSNSNMWALNRHRFSKFWMFTALQWYVLNRTAGIYNWLKQFQWAWKEWKIKTRWDFVEHLDTTNQELKAFINNTLLGAKMSIYTDHVVNDKEYQNNDDEPLKYLMWMSDYLSSLQSTFRVRILTAPLQWLNNYYEYTAATWQSEKAIEWLSAAALNTLWQTLRLFFREWNIVWAFADAAFAYMKTGDLDFASEVTSVAYDKIAGGMWRFMLLPWIDSYGQKPIVQDDDIIWRLFMTYDTTNLSVNEARKIQNMSGIEWMLNDKPWYILRTLQYLPIIKSFMESNKSTWWNEARYKYLQQVMDKDDVLQQLWKWELPKDLLNANGDITKSLYNDLVAFDYSYKKYKWEWEHEVADREWMFGMSQMEESVFIDNIAEKVFWSREAMDEVLIWKSADRKNILKILAASEAGTPGSSRIILSYLARKDFDIAKEEVYWSKYTKSADMNEEIDNSIKAEIVHKRHPYLYIADKTSQYKAVREYLWYAYPDIYKGIENDNDLKQLVNTMAWTDMMVMTEWNKGNVDANYIKNIFNTSAKYVQNTDDRINLVNHTLWVISGMTWPSSEVKQLMKVWVLSANIDFYDSLKQDDLTKLLYKEETDKFENIVWWVIENINMAGNSLAMGDLDEWAARQYYGSSWSRYTKPQYSDWNNRAIWNFLDQANKRFDPINAAPRTNPRIVYSKPSDIGNLSPKRYDIYVKVYDTIYKAFSQDITKLEWRQYPSDTIEWLKFSIKTKSAPTIKRAKWINIKKWKRKSTSDRTKSDLPGGTNDISSD